MTTNPMQQNSGVASTAMRGFILALSAYLMWGVLPLYMKAVSHIGALEVLAHRIVWSVPVAAILLLIMGQLGELKEAIRSPRVFLMACMTAILITVNWGIYIWSVSNDRALDAALGYFINPLFSIFLGAVLLKEKLYRAQLVAIAFAVMGVAILTWHAGALPWVALSLTVSWGLYSFFKKTLPIGATQGFLLEVLILFIPALIYIVYLGMSGQSVFIYGTMLDNNLLLSAGIITAVPLLLYGHGAKHLQLSTLGIMQYIVPTMVLILAVFLFGEPFDTTRLVAFMFIWMALIIYTGAMFVSYRKKA